MPVGAGPSSKTWPRWAPSTLQWTSSRTMPGDESVWSTTKSGSIGFVKLGQPVPLLNLSRLSKRGVSLHTEKYTPSSWLSQNSLRKGGSVPCSRATSYWIGVSSLCHSASVCLTDAFDMSMTTLDGRPQADLGPSTAQAAPEAAEGAGFVDFISVSAKAAAEAASTAIVGRRSF